MKSLSTAQLPSQRTFPQDNTAKQNQITSTYQPGNSTEGISPKKKDLPFKQEQQRISKARSKTETPTNKSKEENQRAKSQSKPETKISQKIRFESLEDMKFEDQQTLKPSNKRKTDSTKTLSII